MTQKLTKNELNRALVEKELLHKIKSDIRVKTGICIALSIPCLPIAIAYLYSSTASDLLPFAKTVFLCFGISFTTPTVLLLLFLLIYLAKHKKILSGEFDIVTLGVRYKCEKIPLILKKRGIHMHYYLYFKGDRRVKIDHTTYQLTTEGDPFYVVQFRNNGRIMLAYPSKMYEYKEP